MIGTLNLIIASGFLAIIYGYFVGKQVLSASPAVAFGCSNPPYYPPVLCPPFADPLYYSARIWHWRKRVMYNRAQVSDVRPASCTVVHFARNES